MFQAALRLMKFLTGLAVFSITLVTYAQAGGLLEQAGLPSMGLNIALEGTACPGIGASAYASNGESLDCVNGTWSKADGGWGGSYFYASWAGGGCATPNPKTGSCSCPAGYSPYNQISIQVGGGVRSLYLFWVQKKLILSLRIS